MIHRGLWGSSQMPTCPAWPKKTSEGEMESGLRGYFDLVFREFDCYATWLPGTGVQLGDIGRLTTGGCFERSGSLATRAEMPAARILEEPDQTVATTGSVNFGSGFRSAPAKR